MSWIFTRLKSLFNIPLNRYEGYKQISRNEGEADIEISEENQTSRNEQTRSVHPLFREYRILSQPNIFRGKFSEMIKIARESCKLILVYIHSFEHSSTDDFIRNVFCNKDFINFVNENFIFFVADVFSREGYQLATSLRATGYPFLSVMMSSYSQNRKLLALGKVEMLCEKEKVLGKLKEVKERALPQLIADKSEVDRITLNRMQREEQDVEYNKSVEIDRKRLEEEEKKKKEKEEEEKMNELKRVDEIKQNELKEKEVEEVIAKIKIDKIDLRNKFLREPMESNRNAIVIRFKFPNGKSIQRRFMSSDSISNLYEFIFSLQKKKDGWEPRESTTMKEIILNTNFPKTILSRTKVVKDYISLMNKQMVYISEE